MTDTEQIPSPSSTAPGPGDPRATFARAVELGGTVIANTRPDQLDLPTPCTEMDVRALLGHLVTVLQRVAAGGRGDDPETWPEAVTGVVDDAWPAAWYAAAHEVQAAWTDAAVLTREVRLPWDTMVGADVLGMFLNEVTVHTWDLARATGQEPDWDDEVVAAAFTAIRAIMPAEGRTELYESYERELPPGMWKEPFALAVEVADDAPVIDRLVAWNGRRP